MSTSSVPHGRTGLPVELCLVGIVSVLVIQHIRFTNHSL
jgi:hypothetical protein